jgi:hypothetical protein
MPLYVSAIEELAAKVEGEVEEDEGGEGEGEEEEGEEAAAEPGQCSPVTTEAVGGLTWEIAAKS